jgi:ABC-type polysaccharide/polyol phosphate transport system ATPase subunit
MAHIRAQNVWLHYPVFTPLATDGSQQTSGDIHSSAGAFITSGRNRVRHIEALKDVSFELRAGDRLGVVGRNGSGKSTLLRVLAGVYEPSQGRIEVKGAVAPLFNMGLGTRVESSGRRNIVLRGLMRGLSKQEAVAKIPEIAEFAGLGDFLDMPVRTYSSGMAMRLSFATATSLSPDILLMDEWFGAGDQEFRTRAQTRLDALLSHAGITVIASHSRSLLANVCSLGLWLHRGEMRAFGPIDQVFEAMDRAEGKAVKPRAIAST